MAQQSQQHQQPQYPPPPLPYSPIQRSDSPHSGPYPAAKRQRLSPNPQSPYSQSPYNSPGLGNIGLPSQVYSGHYNGAQANGAPPSNTYNNYNTYHQNTPYNASNNAYNSVNTVQFPVSSGPPLASSGAMGPPSKPADKPADVNDLGDVMFGSGIDLREEEAALTRASQRPTVPRRNFYQQNNFYSQNLPGDRSTFYGAGTFNQPAVPSNFDSENAQTAKTRRIRRDAEIKAFHNNNPFLRGGSLNSRIKKRIQESQLVVPNEGLNKAIDQTPRQMAISGPDGNDVMKLVMGQDLLDINKPLDHILALLSLATEERIRTIVEDAATLAKGRRAGSHSVIPSDLRDLAVLDGAPETLAVLPTPDNGAVSPTANPLKRSYAEVNATLTPVSDNANSKPIVAPATSVAQALQDMAKAERQQEEERLAKRRRRTQAAAAGGEGIRSGSVSLGTSAQGASSLLGEVAPEVDTKKVPHKKDQKKQMDARAARATEAQQHAATNSAMNMALGGLSFGKKKLSWMSKGNEGPSNPFLPKANTATQSSKAAASNANSAVSTLPKARTFGDFREDMETGKGVQMRDLISVLENDGKEKKALQKAYGRQGSQGKK